MVNGVNNNYNLINAPAGSGKTTYITKEIYMLINKNSKRKILCITFTNRAVDELKSRINSEQVDISTIHSFINKFLSPFKRNKKVIGYYKELYRLDKETKIKSIKYNERVKDNISEGEIGHDSLLKFTYKLCERFPKLNSKLKKYSHIFIDEYQDTNRIILKLFYKGIYGTSVKLYLLGDKMQKIYDRGLDLQLEEILSEFNQSKSLSNNYRSSEPIVDVLNEIYNDKKYEQKCRSDISSTLKPKIILTNNLDQTQKDLISKNKYLTLVLFNKDMFNKAGFGKLYQAYNRIPQYRYGNRYTASDILKESDDNVDDLLNLFKTLFDMYKWIKEKSYGELLRTITKNKYMNNAFIFTTHEDKVDFSFELVGLIKELLNTKTLDDWLNVWKKQRFINSTNVYKVMQEDMYKEALMLSVEQYVTWYEFTKNQYISTQHSVKGEGHDRVIFVSKDGYRSPNIKIYSLFNLWCEVDISFTEIEKFYYDYLKEIRDLQVFLTENLGEKLKCKEYGKIEKQVEDRLKKIYAKFEDNDYFKYFYLNNFKEENISCTTLKNKILKTNELEGVFNAYKIFYVGCSRAKEELIVLIDKNKLTNLDKFKEKFKHMKFFIEE